MRLFSFLLVIFVLQAPSIDSSGDCSSKGFGEGEFVAVSSGNLALPLTENFENWPPAGWTFLTPDGGKGWSRVETGTSPLPGWTIGTVTLPPGGGRYGAYATVSTGGTQKNDQWIIAPPVSITSGDSLFFWMEAQGTTRYPDRVEVRASLSGNNSADFTEVLMMLEFKVGETYPWKKYKADLSGYAGKSITIAWRETVGDNRNEGAFIMLDQVRIGPPVQNDVALIELSLPRYSPPGAIQVSGTLLNYGLKTLTQLDINWQADDGTVHTHRLSGLSVGTDQMYSFTSPDEYVPAPGVRGIKVWLSGINGNPEDENGANDLIFKLITVGSKGVPKLPLIEEFTSSTCPPCASFNATVLNPFLESKRIPAIKYQMNWPAPGDMYYIYDGGVRKQFYNVTAVPTLFIQGAVSQKNSGSISTGITNAEKIPAMIEIKALHQIDKILKKMLVKAVVTPYFTESGYKVHIAVTEKKTTRNTGSNGETEFRSVLMKMIPGGNGTDVDLTDGIPQTIGLQTDLSGSNIEEMDDLEVIVFVQNVKTKEIFQSAFSVEVEDIETAVQNPDAGQLRIFPNPSAGPVTVSYPGEFRTMVYDTQGRLLQQHEKVRFTRNLDLSSYEKGIYFIKIITDQIQSTQRIILN